MKTDPKAPADMSRHFGRRASSHVTNPAAVIALESFRQGRRMVRLPPWFGALAVFLLVFTALSISFVRDGGEAPMTSGTDALSAVSADVSSASFGLCRTGGGTNCVVDGDTFWFHGEKIRIADIDAPETHPSRCSQEAELGSRATYRLQALLNNGPFELTSIDRDEDIYERKLRVVRRNGHSLGLILVEEGLAREWDGARHPWC